MLVTGAAILEEGADDKSLPKEQQVEHAPDKSPRAKQLKLADKICNIQDINADSPADTANERKTQYLDWAVQAIAVCRGVNAQREKRAR